jgi:hypothetical protein
VAKGPVACTGTQEALGAQTPRGLSDAGTARVCLGPPAPIQAGASALALLVKTWLTRGASAAAAASMFANLLPALPCPHSTSSAEDAKTAMQKTVL